MSFRQEIRDTLIANRPKLTEKSLSSYISTLYNIPKKVTPDVNYDKITVKYFKQRVSKILEYLAPIPSHKRKTILSALYILVDVSKYQEKMNEDIADSQEYYKSQQKSQKQEENWIEWPEVLKVHDTLAGNSIRLFKKKNLTATDFNQLKHYILLSCFTQIEPRRVMDYSFMKIRNYDEETDNYYNENEFVFNRYKTASTYGQVHISIPEYLTTLLNIWIEINDSDFMIPTNKGTRTIESSITKMFNKIFNKNISANMLRHSYLTHIYGSIPGINEMEERAKAMGHSVSQALEYVKK